MQEVFRPISLAQVDLERYAELFAACFPGAHKFSLSYLKWLYVDNPNGPVQGFDLYREDGFVAAHYACIPVKVAMYGESRTGLLSLNTATHPTYQGKGLFTKLAQMTYENAQADGFEFVYGIANASSTPGFERKLGFHNVCPLDVHIQLGRSAPIDLPSKAICFERQWSVSDLAWRFADPSAYLSAGGWRLSPVSGQETAGKGMHIYGPGPRPSLPSYCTLTTDDQALREIGFSVPAYTLDFVRPCLSIGLQPYEAQQGALRLPIPTFAKPSPLNFIFKSLSGTDDRVDKDGIIFRVIDFDAY